MKGSWLEVIIKNKKWYKFTINVEDISPPPPYPFIISVSENSTYWNHPKKQNSFVDSMVDKHRRIPPTKQFTLNISALGFIGFRKWRPESWGHSRATERYQLEVLAPVCLSLWHKQRGPFKCELNFPWFSPEAYNDRRCISKKIFSMVWLR